MTERTLAAPPRDLSRRLALALRQSSSRRVRAGIRFGLRRDPSGCPPRFSTSRCRRFDLPPVKDGLLALVHGPRGAVALVNVFASWCTACRFEHPLLLQSGRRTSFHSRHRLQGQAG